MSVPVLNNRWVVAMAGAGLMMMLGTIYSWSLFIEPLIASFAWSNMATTWTFSLATFFLSVGAVIGGRWQDQAFPVVATMLLIEMAFPIMIKKPAHTGKVLHGCFNRLRMQD